MPDVIIGTAGHVDHGKTALVRALTGHDTDRLEEEKRRGITIDLGFAHLDLPDGSRAGLVDVPGHERFIRNMLSGAGGIDLALLVVAADEGVMPQTREHLSILQLLGIRQGIVVVSKIDLVEEDWLELMLEELKEELSGSFLKDAPIHPVSAHTGQGLDQLREAIFALVLQVPAKDSNKPFRLPVDRVFTMPGFGTVVTGTLVEGSLSLGEELCIYPSGQVFRVRSLQVHDHKVESARAGQRVAVNLHKAKVEELPRGSVLAKPGSMVPSMMLDVQLQVLDDSPRIISQGSRLHFHHGSGESLCKLVLLGGREQLLPGESAFAQLRFEEAVAAKAGDPFVLRFFSPVVTVGGGQVLDPSPYKHRASSLQAAQRLHSMHQGSDQERLLVLLQGHGLRFVPLDELAKQAALSREQAAGILREAQGKALAIGLRPGLYLHQHSLDQARARALAALEAFHTKHPLRAGMPREELRRSLFPGQPEEDAGLAIAAIEQAGAITCLDKTCALPGFAVTPSPKQAQLAGEILARYEEAGFSPPEKSTLQAAYAREKEFQGVLEYLLDLGKILPLSPDISFLAPLVDQALAAFSDIQAQKGSVTLADFRDALGTSRKYALCILEYWDRRGITRKVDEARVLAG